jgi:hypothetical protein
MAGMTPLLLEFNPDDGSFVREIRTGNVLSTSIACVRDGIFYGFRWMDKKPYLIKGAH